MAFTYKGKRYYDNKKLMGTDRPDPKPAGKPLGKTNSKEGNKLLTGLVENGMQNARNWGNRTVNSLFNERTSNTTYKTGSQKSTPKATVAGGPSRYDAEQAAAAQTRQARNRKLDDLNRRGEKASAKIVAQYEDGLNKSAKAPASTSKTSTSSGGRFDTSGYSAKYAMGMSADGKVRQYKRDGSKASNAAIARYNMAQKKKGGK